MNCSSCDSQLDAYPCACGYTGQPTPSTAHIRSTYVDRPHGITKEEFGLNVYEVIKTIGGILGIDQQRAAAIHKHEGFKVQALLVRRKALQVILAQQLPTLTDSEMGQVLATYPWITGC